MKETPNKPQSIGSLFVNKSTAGNTYFKGTIRDEKVIGFISSTKQDGTPILNTKGEQLTILRLYPDLGKLKEEDTVREAPKVKAPKAVTPVGEKPPF